MCLGRPKMFPKLGTNSTSPVQQLFFIKTRDDFCPPYHFVFKIWANFAHFVQSPFFFKTRDKFRFPVQPLFFKTRGEFCPLRTTIFVFKTRDEFCLPYNHFSFSKLGTKFALHPYDNFFCQKSGRLSPLIRLLLFSKLGANFDPPPYDHFFFHNSGP